MEIEAKSVEEIGKQKAKVVNFRRGRGTKRLMLIPSPIIAARRLAQGERVNDSPRSRFTISEAVAWADRIMREIDRKWPAADR